MKPVNQSYQLSHQDKQTSSFTSMAIVAEAKRSNCWLYNKLNHTWYTPEEFHAKYANHTDTNINIRSLLENISIRDPRAGIAAYHKLLEAKLERYEKETAELRVKGEAFTQRVLSYYQDKSKDKFR
jgi:hypothetical protein